MARARQRNIRTVYSCLQLFGHIKTAGTLVLWVSAALKRAIDGTRTRVEPGPRRLGRAAGWVESRSWGLVLPPTSVYVYEHPLSPVESTLLLIYMKSLTFVYVYGNGANCICQ